MDAARLAEDAAVVTIVLTGGNGDCLAVAFAIFEKSSIRRTGRAIVGFG